MLFDILILVAAERDEILKITLAKRIAMCYTEEVAFGRPTNTKCSLKTEQRSV